MNQNVKWNRTHDSAQDSDRGRTEEDDQELCVDNLDNVEERQGQEWDSVRGAESGFAARLRPGPGPVASVTSGGGIGRPGARSRVPASPRSEAGLKS